MVLGRSLRKGQKTYKPRHNYQTALKTTVLKFLNENSDDIAKRIIDTNDIEESHKPIGDWKSLIVPIPRHNHNALGKAHRSSPSLPKKLDYATRDEKNRALGNAGEMWVFELEQRRLESEGRRDLAKSIKLVSREDDSLGFDIFSYNTNGTLRKIEVKTTTGGANTTFMISRNEIETSKEAPKSYYLYRVFDFKKSPRVYILQGDLSSALSLVPQQYRASIA